MNSLILRSLITSMLLSVGLPSLAAENATAHSYPLFNGKDLNRFIVENGCKVRVKDGNILLEAGNGWVRSHHVYGDCKLHVEWKALKKAKYDAGIYIRTPLAGKPFPRGGYQINLQQGKEGNIGNLKGASSSGLIKPGDWNAFDVTVVGDTVETKINGKRAYKVGGIANAVGFVGIQVEVPLGGQFLIRKYDVTELSHHSLFNGKDLTGWEGAGRPASDCWTVQHGELVCLKKKGPWLRSKQTFGDFNLRLEYLVNKNGNSGVYVRVPKDGNHHRDDATKPPAGFEVQILDDGYGRKRHLKPYQYCGSVYDIAGASRHVGRKPGEWNSLEINCRGQHVTTIHNGVMIVDVTPEKHPKISLRQLKGYLGLQNHGGGVTFRNLRVGPAIADYRMQPAK
jgi:3-keto-disaccharide hydrolase